MTRDELRKFENKIVQISGRVDRWKPTSEGNEDVLVTAVKVRPYYLDETLAELEARSPIRVDHLWLRLPDKGARPEMCRLDQVFGYGPINWYTRRDGTVDLGCTPIPAIHGGVIANDVKIALKAGAWSEGQARVRLFVEAIKSQEIVVFDELSSPLTIVRDLEQRIVPMLRKNQHTATTAPKNGKGRAPSSFADLLS